MIVKQASNVLDLLEYFSVRQKPASVSEISKHFDWPRSSTFNIISTLASRGYLFEPENKGSFYPASKWLSLIEIISSAAPLPKGVLNIVREVAKRTSETVFVGAMSGMNAVIIEVVPSSYEIRYVADVGKCLPLYATATGQAILSQLSSAKRKSVLNKVEFESFATGTPNNKDTVEESISDSLRRGWFSSSSGYTQDLGGISLPLVVEGRIMAITVAGPLSRIESKVSIFAKILHEETERHLGKGFIRDNVRGLETSDFLTE